MIKMFTESFDLLGSNSNHDEEKLTSFFEKILERGWAKDGTLATDETKMKVVGFLLCSLLA